MEAEEPHQCAGGPWSFSSPVTGLPSVSGFPFQLLARLEGCKRGTGKGKKLFSSTSVCLQKGDGAAGGIWPLPWLGFCTNEIECRRRLPVRLPVLHSISRHLPISLLRSLHALALPRHLANWLRLILLVWILDFAEAAGFDLDFSPTVSPEGKVDTKATVRSSFAFGTESLFGIHDHAGHIFSACSISVTWVQSILAGIPLHLLLIALLTLATSLSFGF